MNVSNRICVLCSFALVAGAATALLIGMSSRPTSRVRSTPLQWGIYQILWSSEYGAQITETISKLASPPDYVMFYRDLRRPFPLRAIECIRERGATPVVSLELWDWHGQKPELDSILDGQYDTQFRAWATEARRHGHRVLWRFGFEFNGNWFTWSGAPKKFVAAWRRVHGIFAEAGAKNVEWIWSPNVVSCPDVPDNDMHVYYPGDAFVDWIGVDGYNFGDHHDQWHRWTSFEAVFKGVLDDFTRRYPNKPVMIAEFASAEGEPAARAAWIREAYDYLQYRPEVRAAIWFNFDKRREGEQNWRIDASPESLAAFNETFATPREPPRRLTP